MLARNFEQGVERRGTGIVDKWHTDKASWIDFCLFPDIVEPVKMPTLFPIPSHIAKRQTVFTIQAPAAGNIYGLWKPHTIDTSSASSSGEGYRSGFFYKTGAPSAANTDASGGADQQISSNPTYNPPLTAAFGLMHGGARLIGSFIEIEYIGTADQHSGLFECGLHMHTVNSMTDMAYVHFYDQSEMVQAPFYRKFKPIDGIRCVWFPVDENDFSFQDYDISSSGIGETTTSANLTIRNPVQPQWAINLTGLQNNQSLRIHMCSFYETIVDEAYRDIFMATRDSNIQDPAKARVAVTEAVANGAAATPSKSSGGFGQMLVAAKEYVNNLKGVYGMFQQALPAIASMTKGAISGGITGGPLGAVSGGAYGLFNSLT